MWVVENISKKKFQLRVARHKYAAMIMFPFSLSTFNIKYYFFWLKGFDEIHELQQPFKSGM